MPERASATLRRKELGRRLRALRVQKNLAAQDVATFLECSPAKVSRIESGARAVNIRDVRLLCDLYEVEPEARARLEELVRDSKQSSWYQSLDVDYGTYIGLEQSAATISEFQPLLVPGLMQTREYATALIEALVPELPAAVLEERVDARMGRQGILKRDDPPEVHLFIDELAFGRVIGSPEVMAEQTEALVEASRSPAVHIQIIPTSAGAYPGYPFTFALLEFPNDEIPPVAYLEQHEGDLYLERREDIARFRRVLNSLRSVGLSPKESRNRLESHHNRFKTGVI
ncbi:helix-turn-helix domain-containing protein [Actinomycetospora flava]|uniref:Helix-turn-helix transcriptional regulator n=1 Tax=Actinomycetospora flava TaxID=3129232 RepID=A0ABU8M9J7_9PSEU